jgi:hypothetical protein
MAEYDLIMKIREKLPNFDEQELLNFTKASIPHMHKAFIENRTDKIKEYCCNSLIEKILNNNVLYRISPDIDNVRVEFTRLEGYSYKDDKFYVKVYASLYFYDDVENNLDSIELYDKYWNDIWVITYEGNGNKQIANQCPTCGAYMKYDTFSKMFKCEYCGNGFYYSSIEWKMIDIDVNQTIYK